MREFGMSGNAFTLLSVEFSTRYSNLQSFLYGLHIKMIASSAARARLANSLVARRAFSTTRAQLSSPYHYAEGPRTNIPFNPKTKYFFVRYWAFMITGFGAPFAIAAWQTFKTRS